MDEYTIKELGDASQPQYIQCSKCNRILVSTQFKFRQKKYGKTHNYYVWTESKRCNECRIRKTKVFPKEYAEKLQRQNLPSSVVEMKVAKRRSKGKAQRIGNLRKTLASKVWDDHENNIKALDKEHNRLYPCIYKEKRQLVYDYLVLYMGILKATKKFARYKQSEAHKPVAKWIDLISDEHKKELSEGRKHIEEQGLILGHRVPYFE